MKAIQFVRPAISAFLSVAVILSLMFAVCGPFLNMGISGLMGVYADMADAVASGSGGEYADGLMTQMDAGSQMVIGDLGSWADGVIEKVGANEFVAGIIDFIEGLQ